MYKHLVIPGGGPSGLKALGALQYLEINKYWNIENIETIYATSVGAILAILLCLRFDWESINDYIIKRNWKEIFHINVNQIFEAYQKKGIFDNNMIELFYKPFFNARDLSLNITMKDFFIFSKIELHVFTLEINNFELVDISYKTHPDLPLLIALQMTIAIPILIVPYCNDDKCYVDGGVICNYPINYCIERAENIDEIFGLRNNYIKSNNIVKNDSTILDYVISFIYNLIKNVKLKKVPSNIPNELIYDIEHMSLTNIQQVLTSSEYRKELIDSGIESAKEYLELKNREKIEEKEEEEEEEKEKIEKEIEEEQEEEK